MKKFIAGLIVIGTLLTACEKEVSLENGGAAAVGNVVGNDCRISRIVYSDSASGVGFGALNAAISAATDKIVTLSNYDSLNGTLNYFFAPIYKSDTLIIDSDQYFLLDASTFRVKAFHGLFDPTNPFSGEIDIAYTYDASGFLTTKTYSSPLLGGLDYEEIRYSYASGNLVGMEQEDLFTGSIISNATISYNSLAPKNYINIFPDELDYQNYTQFLNYGRKNVNAVSKMVVRSLDPFTGDPVDSLVSTFSSYVLSTDKYVLSCIMKGDDQPSIPAEPGKLVFKYACK